MVLTDVLRKEIESDIERCKLQVEIAGSEVLYNNLIAKYKVIDPNFEDGFPRCGKATVMGCEPDYRSEIQAIASKLDMWLKVCPHIPAGPKEKVQELITRGVKIREEEFHPAEGGAIFSYSYIDGPQYRIWINEIYTFANRHLKGHPLCEKILSECQYKNGSVSVYNSIMGYLEAIRADKEFFVEPVAVELSTSEHDLPTLADNKVFVVHGHDDAATQEVARILEKAGLEAIILREQASGGSQTIIEKIETNTDVAFAVVLYTPCDFGRAKEQKVEQGRARQNVVFEHGYLMGKLGRSHVCPLVKGSVETPGDISGVVYIPMDDNGAWKFALAKEMKSAGLAIDANKFL